MKAPASILLWLKRGLLLGALVLFAGFLILYFWSVSIVEAFVLPRLEARGGQLEIESIGVSLSGAELRVARYEEPNLLVEGLSVICPWNQLWTIRDGFAGSLHSDSVRIQLDEGASTEAEGLPEPISPAARVAELAALIDSLPMLSFEVEVDELIIAASDQEILCGLSVFLLQGLTGETHLTAALKAKTFDVDARVKVLAGGAGLSLDFTLSAGDWDSFQANYLRSLLEPWAEAGTEVYVNSLGAGRGFMDVSGYARWLQSEPSQLSFTVLADLGSSELYWPTGEVVLGNTSAGLAFDGLGHARAYAKGAVDSVRASSWMESGGDWALRSGGRDLEAEFRLGESIALSLAHDDWRQLFVGAGDGRFYLEAGAVNGELLRALDLPEIFDDLSLDMGVKIEGDGTLEDWMPVSAQIHVDGIAREAQLTSQGISVVNATTQVDLKVAGASIQSGALDLSVQGVDLLGFALQKLNLHMVMNQDGRLVLQPSQADFLGGELRIDRMELDPLELEGATFVVRLQAIDLSQLAAAVPQFKGEIDGQVSGHLVGSIKGGQPVLTDGRLEIDPDQGARLSYDVSGLLTRGMAEGTAAYKQYRMAELAFEDLALKQFSIDVFPDGNTTRPFRLEFFGESLQGKTVVPVDFNLNVNVDDTSGVFELLRMIQRGELDF
ncbi:intermembrane phospholipid transport protein YdbH family protein [Coraliomargarita sp. W4R53]